MFQGLRTVVYHVADINQAKEKCGISFDRGGDL